jgi:predicted nucleic acid-binding protein
VPATEHAFVEPLPARLYVDTNLIIDYFVNTNPHHGRVVAFVDRLARNGLTALYISPLTWFEFAHTIRRQDFRDKLPPGWWQQYRLHRWEDPRIRQQYLEDWYGLFEGLLAQFGWSEVVITPAVRVRALGYVSTYNLKPQDAAHLACAFEEGVADLASFDEGFRRVDSLHLWNDKIHM